ncbi:MAG: DUF1501 domain-containing protein [Verrucomicrobiaceae bacterium]|jgi:hypothetical protein|nr:DUF1501 domain-containing protein [Verrucomicrobiaceae bacterium]NCF93335.1 DUF1501 domain-containing protein [Verrucomicrobiaceae bacterium]
MGAGARRDRKKRKNLVPNESIPSAREHHVHDLHATILHLLGIEHELLTYFHQGRKESLTDVHRRVVEEIIA